MKSTIHIIPGLGGRCTSKLLKHLGNASRSKGYNIHFVNPNWYKPLSEQVFPIKETDIVFGFSMGATLAYLIVKKYPCKKAIFASMPPNSISSRRVLKEVLLEHMSKTKALAIVNDEKQAKISLKKLKVPYITIAGENESIKAEVVVPDTGHELTPAYIEQILKFL